MTEQAGCGRYRGGMRRQILKVAVIGILIVSGREILISTRYL